MLSFLFKIYIILLTLSIIHIDKENKSIDEVDINSAGNTTEHKDIHLPLLEEDVFSDMHNALVS